MVDTAVCTDAAENLNRVATAPTCLGQSTWNLRRNPFVLENDLIYPFVVLKVLRVKG